MYKIWTKAYQLWLTPILSRFISTTQSAFLPDRSIHHSILLTNEILHRAGLSEEDFIFLKLDVSKAFDKLEWDFLLALLQHLGFGPQFLSFILATKLVANSLVVINEQLSKIFRISRSVR